MFSLGQEKCNQRKPQCWEKVLTQAVLPRVKNSPPQILFYLGEPVCIVQCLLPNAGPLWAVGEMAHPIFISQVNMNLFKILFRCR